MSKLRKPSKNNPAPAPQTPPVPEVEPLGSTPGELVMEWRNLQAQIVDANAKIRGQHNIIQEAQQRIKEANEMIQRIQQVGFQVVGQANTISRILKGMGVDPNEFSDFGQPFDTLPEVENDDEVVDFPSEVIDPEEDIPSPGRTALRKRFRR